MNPYLFVMLGYPGSGKSYFARQLAKHINAVRLNGDNARHMMFDKDEVRKDPTNNPIVFGALDYATQQILDAGYSVVYDASHNKKSDRTSASKLTAIHNTKPIIIWVQIPVDTAKARQRDREVLPDQPTIAPERLEQLIANLQPPEELELCIKINGQQPFAEQLKSFQLQLEEIESNGPQYP